ncbi:alpha-tubulin N-acetyltransferase-like [Chrysoperla carnea]|uniref:alpha-tubulin N-acetyltransferase-like n=1 Tax=Chrysoperla carnea TaxID=189513 RepID=UPI001D063390|nr:alpha-tubulin N-acetyltransferase-like [Chrysoperla carnea]
MEFNFNINDIFKEPIVKITNTLLPPSFSGDRRAVRECQTNVAEVINCMGEASATAQGLSKPITTSDKLRNSDHILYLLLDLQGGAKGKGCVTGLLKVGRKSLYVFDPSGCNHKLNPLCILDFYVHESRQRTGLGRRLFEHMLKDEDVEPVRLAIDRPSKKFLGFLSKHYHLNRVIPQMNNFVVFEGFFVENDESTPQSNKQNNNSISLTSNFQADHHGGTKLNNGLNSATSITAPTLGRYGAPRPPCSMGQIIHNQTPQLVGANDSSGSDTELTAHEEINLSKLERPRSLSIQTNADDQPQPITVATEGSALDDHISIDGAAQIASGSLLMKVPQQQQIDKIETELSTKLSITKSSAATTPRSVVGTPRSSQGHQTPASQTKKADNLTDQGFVDLKFYHSKLW